MSLPTGSEISPGLIAATGPVPVPVTAKVAVTVALLSESKRPICTGAERLIGAGALAQPGSFGAKEMVSVQGVPAGR